METTAERIAKAMDIRGIKQVELCEKTGIGKSSISTYLSGDYIPKQKNLYKIACALDVSEGWLLGFDDVPMERVADKPNKTVTTVDDLSEPKRKLFVLMKAADDQKIQEILDYANYVLSKK